MRGILVSVRIKLFADLLRVAKGEENCGIRNFRRFFLSSAQSAPEWDPELEDSMSTETEAAIEEHAEALDETIRLNIVKQMRAKRWTQIQLGSATGLSQHQIHRIVSGKQPIRLPELAK